MMPNDGVWGTPADGAHADLLHSLSKTNSRTSDDHNMSTNSYLSLSSMAYGNNANQGHLVDASIDAELASIVSSLSALSHTNTNTMPQQQQQQASLLSSPNLQKIGTATSSNIGGSGDPVSQVIITTVPSTSYPKPQRPRYLSVPPHLTTIATATRIMAGTPQVPLGTCKG